MTYLQSQLWSIIKKREPGFIQGLTKSETMTLFRSRVRPEMRSVSIDGSAFDSSQLASLMELTDDQFWYNMQGPIRDFLASSDWANPEMSAAEIVRDATKKDLFMFTVLPGANLPVFSPDMKKASASFGGLIETETLCTPLHGTTFSGHPTRTTLGNTFRSLLYMYYYLEQAGYHEPWTRDDMFVAASGDDTVLWMENPDRAAQSITQLTSRVKQDEVPIGLAQ